MNNKACVLLALIFIFNAQPSHCAYSPKNTNGQATMANSEPVVIASDQSAVPVSGTVTANAGSGTMAVSAASLPLPSGASTAAKQPALGTAGTASSDVITVQGIASMTALKVDGSAVTQPISGTVTANAGSGTMAVSLASVPSHAVTNAGTFATQENGALLTSAQLIDDAIATTASAITTKGMAASGTDGTNARILKTDTSGELQVDVLTVPTITVNSHAVTNAGTFATQESGALLTSAQLIDDAVYASDAVLSKTLGVGAVLDDTATVAITENQAGYLRMSPRRALLVEGVASGTALNVLDTNSSAALTALQTLDNVVSGSGANISQMGGTNISMNTGVRDAGTQRVTIATNDAVPVTFTGSTDVATQTTLSALNTKVVAGAGTEAAAIRVTLPTDGTGVVTAKQSAAANLLATVNNRDGAGNALTSNSTTYTAKFAQDANILGTLGTAFSTAGKVDVKGADGDVFVRQATATNLKSQAECYQGGVAVGAAAPLQVSLANTGANGTAVAVSLASVPSHAVTNAGTFAVQDSQVIADNGVFTDGTSKLFPAGFIYDEVAGTALTENDIAAPRLNVNRATVSTIEDGVTRARYATVKAASTAAATTDLALVVSSAGANSATKIGDGTNNAAIKAASTAAAFTDPALTIDARPGGALVTASASLADALANPTLGKQAVLNHVYNGSTWDLQRGMSVATTTGDSGAKTATGNGATQTNVGNKGVQIFIVLGTVSGTTPTCTFKVQGSVDGGTNFYDIPGATTASLTASTNVGILIYPGSTVLAGTTTTGTTATCSSIIPRTWRIVWTIGGTTPSFTITSITYNYIPN